MRIRAAVLSAIAALSAGTVAAGAPDQPAASQFAERVEVRLVQVDAWAVASGKPMLDLQQSELKLYEDGKPVDILYFAAPVVELEPPSEGEAAPGELRDATVEPQRLTEPATVAIFLDETHLGVGSRSRTIAALREWVASGGVPVGADVMLVSHERELRVLVGRTPDETRLLDALVRLTGPSTAAIETRGEERRTLEQIREQQRAALEMTRERGIAGPGAAGTADEGEASILVYGEPPCSGRLLQLADSLGDRVTDQAEATLDSLSAFAASMAALQGRKLLVFVSEGMPSRPGGVAFDYVRTLCDGSGVRDGIQYAIDVAAQPGRVLPGQLGPSQLTLAGENRHLAGTIDRAVASANTSGVTVWTFGALGLTESGADASQEVRTTTMAALSRQKGESQDVLAALAADTGGRAVLDSNAFGAALGELADDLFSSYSIAFASPRAGDGKLHQIRLETTRPGVRLRYRRSWRDSSSEEELAGLVGGALAFGIDRPGLGAVATIGRQQGQAGEQRLILRLTLPRAALTPVPGIKGGGQGLLRLAIALQPAGGEASPIRTRTIKVETLGGRGEPIVQDIALPEIGRGALVVVGLRDEVSGEIGVIRLEVGGS